MKITAITAITAIAPWFGGKRNLAPAIVEELGPHRGYWEPFCGSLAVLLAKPRVSQETANDLHGDLINLARVLQERRGRPPKATTKDSAFGTPQMAAMPRSAGYPWWSLFPPGIIASAM